MKKKPLGSISLNSLILMVVTFGLMPPTGVSAEKFPDPGKGYDYVFFGYSPAMGEGGVGNRAMLLIDIDGVNSPRHNPEGAQFKLLVEDARFTGRLDILSVVEPATPVAPDYFRLSGTILNPQRAMFTYRGVAEGGAVNIQGDALLEANNLHYLRAVMDVHYIKRNRYVVNCLPNKCDAP